MNNKSKLDGGAETPKLDNEYRVKHEGLTHNACEKRLAKFGGKTIGCCCNGHECQPEAEEKKEECEVLLNNFPSEEGEEVLCGNYIPCERHPDRVAELSTPPHKEEKKEK